MIRHNFWEGNKIAHVLANEGSKQATSEYLSIITYPSESVFSILQADKEGLSFTRIVPIFICNKLASLGNSCILAIHDSGNVTHYASVTP